MSSVITYLSPTDVGLGLRAFLKFGSSTNQTFAMLENEAIFYVIDSFSTVVSQHGCPQGQTSGLRANISNLPYFLVMSLIYQYDCSSRTPSFPHPQLSFQQVHLHVQRRTVSSSGVIYTIGLDQFFASIASTPATI